MSGRKKRERDAAREELEELERSEMLDDSAVKGVCERKFAVLGAELQCRLMPCLEAREARGSL